MTDVLTTVSAATEESPPKVVVFDNVQMSGDVNTPDAQLRSNIRHSIRLGYPQLRQQPIQSDRVCIVGGGPSLTETFEELRDLYFDGAKIVTVNGAYQWCLDRNIRPSMQVVVDARPENARFVDPDVPRCGYFLASQCHPETWARVAGREQVWIWHAMGPGTELRDILDEYYQKHWHALPGGTTVISRAIPLVRTLGYVRMDLFGVDCCVFDKDQHHAYAQPENDRDRILSWHIGHEDGPRQTWHAAGWMIQQWDDLLRMFRSFGHTMAVTVHGRGLLAYAMGAGVSLDARPATDSLER